VLSNRKGGSERVIDLVEARAPDGFNDIAAIASHAEREAMVRGYASMAGYAQEQVNETTETLACPTTSAPTTSVDDTPTSSLRRQRTSNRSRRGSMPRPRS
jgi:hypothetical protein